MSTSSYAPFRSSPLRKMSLPSEESDESTSSIPGFCRCSRYANNLHMSEDAALKQEILRTAATVFPVTSSRGATLKIVGCDKLKRFTNKQDERQRSWVLCYRELLEYPTNGDPTGERQLIMSEWANTPDLALSGIKAALAELRKPHMKAIPIKPKQLAAFEKTCSMCGLSRKPKKSKRPNK